jgi:hypothetical protein
MNTLESMQSADSNFPNRFDFPDPLPDEHWTGPYSGFASRMNVFTWQQSYALAGSTSEEFADQFLGWTYNTWETGTSVGGFSEAGSNRSYWMNNNMPGWINGLGNQ